MNNALILREKTRNMNLLFVEDSEIVRMSAVKLFEEFFDEIFIGVDGKEGLNLYLEFQEEIDLIITDINMPNMDGIEMVELIKKENPQMPILFFTANDDAELNKNFNDLNIENILRKPIIISDFIDSVNKLL